MGVVISWCTVEGCGYFLVHCEWGVVVDMLRIPNPATLQPDSTAPTHEWDDCALERSIVNIVRGHCPIASGSFIHLFIYFFIHSLMVRNRWPLTPLPIPHLSIVMLLSEAEFLLPLLPTPPTRTVDANDVRLRAALLVDGVIALAAFRIWNICNA